MNKFYKEILYIQFQWARDHGLWNYSCLSVV